MQINGKFTRFALWLDFVLAARERRGLINFLQTAFSLQGPKEDNLGRISTKELYFLKINDKALKH